MVFIVIAMSACTLGISPELLNNWNNGGSDTPPSNPAKRASITQYGITWTFDKEYQTGQYANGDWWVVGPIVLHGISNSGYHVDGRKPGVGNDISIVNPPTDYTARLDIGYDDTHFVTAHDVSRPGGKGGPLISPANPYTLAVNSSLMSCVSWLDGETTGKPEQNDRTRTIAVLTCVSAAPPEGSFRPPYVGTDKASYYNTSDVDASVLKNWNRSGIKDSISLSEAERYFERVWFDVCDYAGEHIYPINNFPATYGAYVMEAIVDSLLILNSDVSIFGKGATKTKLLYRALQLAIDTSGLADNGMSWAMSGSHLGGRKMLILFGGTVFHDDHMLSIGERGTHFSEEDNTFYVGPADVALCDSSGWHPDSRSPHIVSFENADLGEPMWDIRRIAPGTSETINNSLDSIYMDINANYLLAITTLARTMGFAHRYNHAAMFDFVERYIADYHYFDGTSYGQWHSRFAANLEPTPIQVNYYSPYSTSGSLPPADGTSYYATSPITLRENSGGLSRQGYAFGGWNTKADGSGTTYAAGSTVYLASTTALFALWTPK
jgi:hypothetical protein